MIPKTWKEGPRSRSCETAVGGERRCAGVGFWWVWWVWCGTFSFLFFSSDCCLEVFIFIFQKTTSNPSIHVRIAIVEFDRMAMRGVSMNLFEILNLINNMYSNTTYAQSRPFSIFSIIVDRTKAGSTIAECSSPLAPVPLPQRPVGFSPQISDNFIRFGIFS